LADVYLDNDLLLPFKPPPNTTLLVSSRRRAVSLSSSGPGTSSRNSRRPTSCRRQGNRLLANHLRLIRTSTISTPRSTTQPIIPNPKTSKKSDQDPQTWLLPPPASLNPLSALSRPLRLRTNSPPSPWLPLPSRPNLLRTLSSRASNPAPTRLMRNVSKRPIFPK
jgi:hypothetical protein